MQLLRDIVAAIMFLIGLCISGIDLLTMAFHSILHRVRFTVYIFSARLFRMDKEQIATLHLIRATGNGN